MEEIIKFSKDERVKFVDSTHVYTDRLTGKKLRSVTSLISDFKPVFDKEKVSKAYAKKHGMKQADVLALWKAKGDKASSMGTDIHKIFEDYVNYGEIMAPGKWGDKEDTAVHAITELFVSNRLKPIETELIVYNEKYAGQIDLIAMNEQGEYFIIDWKTNNEITGENKWRQMLPPYEDYPDANLFHYALQLRIYKELCKEYDIKDCFIVHIQEERFDIIQVPEMNLPKLT